jgi:hypothetical protein
MILSKYTVLQLIVACGLSRRLERSEICRISNCTQGYITKLLMKQDFHDLVTMFQLLPPDNDTEEYQGRRTIMMEVGRLIYLYGDKLSG